MNNKNKSNNDWIIPLYKIYTDDEDIELITKIIKRGSKWALGPEIEELEKNICDYVGSDFCVTLNSGTSALHASLLAYNIKEFDEVIVPSFSFISTVNSVLFVKGVPIFSDIEEDTYGLDPGLIKSCISDKTKAIMPMDYGGSSCKIQEIQAVAKENNLIVIEDAAEALGAKANGIKVGSTSDASIFSFCGNKVLTTGEGGAVTTNSKEIFEKLKTIRSHGRVDNVNYFENPEIANYVGVGYNWRMSSITAGLGITQLRKLDKLIYLRQKNAELLSSKLSKHKQIKTPNSPNGYEHIYQMYTIKLNNKKTRDGLKKFLLKKKIFCKIYFNPIHMTDFYKQKFPQYVGKLKITEKVADLLLTLPIYPNMTKEEIDYITNTVDEYFEMFELNS